MEPETQSQDLAARARAASSLLPDALPPTPDSADVAPGTLPVFAPKTGGVPIPRVWWPWIIIAATTVLCGMSSLIYPFGNDQLTYCFYGDAVLHGKVLYRDIPMMQMPLTGMVHALALVLFGRQMTSIRILDLLWTLATALLIYQFVTKGLRGRWLAITAGALYPILYYLNDWWQTAQPDGFLNLPVAAAFLLLLHELTSNSPPRHQDTKNHLCSSVFICGFFRPRHVLLPLSAGVLIGLALLFKYPIAFVLPSLALMPFLVLGWHSTRARRTSGWLVLGCLLTLIAFLSALAITGAFPDFVKTQIGLIPAYTHAGGSALNPVTKLLTMFWTVMRPIEYQLMVWLGLIGLVAGIGALLGTLPVFAPKTGGVPIPRTDHGSRLSLGLVLLWLLSGLLSVYLQGKMLHYHYQALLPPIAILGALALAAVFRLLWQRLGHVALKCSLFAATVLGLLTLTVYHDRFVQLWILLRDQTSLQDYWRSSLFYFGDYSVAENLEVNDYVARNTAPLDRVAELALYPQQTFPVWRDPVVRFSTTYSPDPTTWKLPVAWRNSPLAASSPELFIVRHDDRVPWVRGHNLDSYEELMAFPELRSMILDNYELETRIRHADVLRRADSDHQLPAAAPNPKVLDAELREAMQFIGGLDSAQYRTILWPLTIPGTLPVFAPKTGGVPIPSKLISHRTLNRTLWLGEKTLPDYLPIISVWIKNDDRPLALQHPLAVQNDGDNVIADGFRFTLIHKCRQGLILIYLVERATGNEHIDETTDERSVAQPQHR